MKELLKNNLVCFWLGMGFGMSITAIIVGNNMIHKSVLSKKMVYLDGKFYYISDRPR